MSPRYSVSNYFQRHSSESVLTRLWFRWKSHSDKNGIEHVPRAWHLPLLKFTRRKRIAPDRTAIHAEANNGECFTVRYSSNSCLREFSNKVPQYLTTRFCMQTFSEFPCQHKIEATSSLFLEHHHQSETIKTNWPASVWKCKQREYVSFPNYYSWFSLFGSILISTLLFAGSHI